MYLGPCKTGPRRVSTRFANGFGEEVPPDLAICLLSLWCECADWQMSVVGVYAGECKGRQQRTDVKTISRPPLRGDRVNLSQHINVIFCDIKMETCICLDFRVIWSP
jgi:hypothetical protein